MRSKSKRVSGNSSEPKTSQKALNSVTLKYCVGPECLESTTTTDLGLISIIDKFDDLDGKIACVLGKENK